MKSLNKLLVLGLIAGTSALTGCITSGSSSDASSDASARTQSSSQGFLSKNFGKVTVCHVPPGNPAQAHTISVGSPAVRAHLDHGDYLGDCSDVIPPIDTIPPTDTLPPVIPPVDSIPSEDLN